MNQSIQTKTAAAFLASVALAAAVHAQTTTFTDRASWEAALGDGFQTETFDGIAPTGELPEGLSTVGLLTVGFEKDLFATGVVRVDDGAAPDNVNGTDFLYTTVNSGNPSTRTTLVFDPPVRAWGADYVTGALAPTRIQLDGGTLTEIASGESGFIGFTSNTPVSRVTFDSRFVSEAAISLDNVSSGDEAFLVWNLDDGPVAAPGDLPGSLRQAIFDAEANIGADRIVFDPALTGVITLTEGQMRIQGAVGIQGPGAEKLTVSGGDATRLFEVGGPGSNTYTFAGLTLADGNSGPSYSGAIDMFDGDDSLRILDCVVRNNRNLNRTGSAISVIDGSLKIVNSAVMNNSGGQGVVYLQSCDAVISNSTFSGNTGNAGDLWIRGFNGDASVSLEFCTFAGFAGGFGGITYRADQANSSTLIRYRSNVFASSSSCFSEAPSEGVNTLESLGYNVVLDATSDAFAAATDLTSTDPMLAPLEPVASTFAHMPLAGSPARNAGDSALTLSTPDVPETDQRGAGFDRILEGRIDIGSIESTLEPVACSAADITTNGSPNGIPDSLVTLSDFSFYLTLWSQSDPAADITANGQCNLDTAGDGVSLSDFSCYLTLWSQGCP